MDMDRLTKAPLGLIAGAVMMAIAASPAQAVETFVCDDGRVLTLTSEQVDVLVTTDPCIAAYYGRQIDPAAAAATARSPAPAPGPAAEVAEPPPAVPVDLPLPERRPEDIAAQLRSLAIDPTAPAGERKPVAIADVPSDFRNVHIINGARGGAPQYYQHTR